MPKDIVALHDAVIDVQQSTFIQAGHGPGPDDFRLVVEQMHVPSKICRVALMYEGAIVDASPAMNTDIVMNITSDTSQSSISVHTDKMVASGTSFLGYRFMFLTAFSTSDISVIEILQARTSLGITEQLASSNIQSIIPDAMASNVSIQGPFGLNTTDQTITLDLKVSAVAEDACLLTWSDASELLLTQGGKLQLKVGQNVHSFAHPSLISKVSRIAVRIQNNFTLLIDESIIETLPSHSSSTLQAIGRSFSRWSFADTPKITGSVRNIYCFSSALPLSELHTSMTSSTSCVFAWTCEASMPEIKSSQTRVPRVSRFRDVMWNRLIDPATITSPSVLSIVTVGSSWNLMWTSTQNISQYEFSITWLLNGITTSSSASVNQNIITASIHISTRAEYTVKLFAQRLGQTTQLSVITKTQSTFAQFPVAITSFTTSSSHGLPDVNGIDQRAVVDHAVKQFIDFDCSLENITIARILSNGNELWNDSMPGVTVNSSQVEYDFIARGSPPYAITVVLRGQDNYEQSYVAPNPIAANETLSFPDVLSTTRSVSNASLGTTMTLTTNFNKTLQDVDISNISITSQNDAQIEIGIINGSTMQYSMAVNEIEAYSGTYTMSFGNVQRSYIWFCILFRQALFTHCLIKSRQKQLSQQES